MNNPEIQISFRDANNERCQIKDQVYLVRYDSEGYLHLYPCVVTAILTAINGKIKLVTHGPTGPETIETIPLEIYKNPQVLLQQTIINLEKLTKTTPENIIRMQKYLEDIRAGTIQKFENVKDTVEEI